MVMRLYLLFGTTGFIGLKQISNGRDRGQSEVIFNITFAFIYNFLRSGRGIFMFVLLATNIIIEKVQRFFKNIKGYNRYETIFTIK